MGYCYGEFVVVLRHLFITTLFPPPLPPTQTSFFITVPFFFVDTDDNPQGGGCGSHFFDITDSFAEPIAVTRAAAYPTSFQYSANIRRLFPSLSWANIKKNLEQYSTFHTRFSETQSGADAAQWLLAQVQAVVKAANKPGVSASAFPHSLWPQNSIIARIQGRSNRTVVVGAHLDSINSANRLTGRAPGVDDDGSGSMLLLEALRVLLTDSAFAGSNNLLENTIEFHWYAAEEGGLRGSQDIFTQYKNAGRDIWAMLQQDMVGYTKGTLNAGKPESFGLITDFTDAVLNQYLVGVIGEVRLYPHFPYGSPPPFFCHEEKRGGTRKKEDEYNDTDVISVHRHYLRQQHVRLRMLRPRIRHAQWIPRLIRLRIRLPLPQSVHSYSE